MDLRKLTSIHRSLFLENTPSDSWGIVQFQPTTIDRIVFLNTPSGSWGMIQIPPRHGSHCFPSDIRINCSLLVGWI
jgi:hypothetical protein